MTNIHNIIGIGGVKRNGDLWEFEIIYISHTLTNQYPTRECARSSRDDFIKTFLHR